LKRFSRAFQQTRGGRKTDEVAEKIDFTTVSPYFMLEKAKSGVKTILSAREVMFSSLATSITTP